ncbi:hypothetical protein DSO57_1032335 [Entomophthora muscae]|uniref:Uncharacterized protein n=1 Tax=Entomophthora muscae TaxID=34485 RepID=A0ACC2TZH3_9FUNG|nr:hypothetical protein DSO57_1032335 [Entomophthora muscae]
MKILTSKAKTLEIQLVEPEVYMRGTLHRGYSSGQVRGVVKLQLSTQKRALSLKLTLVGTIQTNWATEGRVCREQMEVLRQEWSFDTTHRKNDIEFFPFQAVLPSTLPPSTTVRGGRVKYWLEAQLVRPRRWDTRVSRELLVLRVESPTSSVLSEGVYASGSFKGLFDYQLSCPHRTFGPGDQVPVRFQLTTKDAGVDIKMISALIKRTTTLRTIKNQLTKQKEGVVDINHRALNHPSRVDETIVLNPSCHKGIWNSQNFVSDTSESAHARAP